MKFTLSWLKEHLDTDEPRRKARRQAHHDRARGRAHRGQGEGACAVHHRAGDLRRAASQCGPPARLHGRYRRRVSAGAGRVRCAECARGSGQRVLRARHLHSRQEHHARRRHHPRRRKPRHAVLGSRTADLGESRRHHGASGGSADRQELRRMGRARRSRVRNQSDPEPPGLRRRAWHRARPCRGRHGQVQGPSDQAGEGRISLPGEGDGRGLKTLSGLRVAAGARRQERSIAEMAAGSPDLDRLAAHQRAGRYHELHDLRPRPSAACVRRPEGPGQSCGAPRARRRDAARARWPHLHARCRRLRDRGRSRRRIAGRHHGRRGVGLRRRHHRGADRNRRFGTKSTSLRPAASSASIRTRATASSVASIRISWCRGWSSRPGW